MWNRYIQSLEKSRRQRNRIILLGLALLILSPSLRADTEPWADPALPVKDGLILWIDSAKQSEARSHAKRQALAANSPVEMIFDGSGTRRNLHQRNRDSQPRLLTKSGRSVLRFDGKDDYLERTDLDLKLDQATVFIVASPSSNLGGFRGLVSMNQLGINDYVSGFTIDLGPSATTRFETLNVEGKGFPGIDNLIKEPMDFNAFHLLQVIFPPESKPITTWIDDRPQRTKNRKEETLDLDEMTLGARGLSHEPRPPYAQGFLHGDIAEVIIYRRALDETERSRVAGYLTEKHRGLSDLFLPDADAPGTRSLKAVKNPPVGQMLVPGFSVQELPLDLPNINNLRYRHDGKLVALAYNGNVYILSDTDGDGLEDHAELFWDNRGRLRAPIGLALTPKGDKRGNGVYIPSRGKCSLIVDTNGDDLADEEIIVAEGWHDIFAGVDSLGITLGPDGSVYFGLGTADYTNAYQTDKQGNAAYSLKSERGTILKVAPDFKHREIVATGIRFPVGIAFNSEGDLFATDQEGATWMPNGNPFDELIHVRTGRHYGFPPRHSKHLPDVIDEPSTFDYGPQHQSTCGLCFNDPNAKGAIFGPRSWLHDAFVCGYSRAKLYRTELVKVRGEYVARNALIGCFQMLLADSCLTPDGAMLLAAHSGAPDWGSGPDGRGKLFKVSYTNPDQPQPVAAWSNGPREVRIAFDRPLDPSQLRDLASRVDIEFGSAVSPGDRFESLRPGYAVVVNQLNEPRRVLKVQNVNLTPDRRTILIATEPMAQPVSYAVNLPGLGRTAATGRLKNELSQAPETDLGFDLTGCAIEWRSASGESSWSGWLPHPDLQVARTFTKGSAEHDVLWPLLDQPGTLTIRCQLRMASLLRPAVQPGAYVDDKLPAETGSIQFRSRAPFSVNSTAAKTVGSQTSEGLHQETLSVTGEENKLVPVEIAIETGPGANTGLDVDYITNEDARPRALALNRIYVPWARPGEAGPASAIARKLPDELKGGDWRRGKALFLGAEAQCSKCHTVQGQGGQIGPDLSNLGERDYESVLRDITSPSAAIHPDYVNYQIATTDGRVFNGPVRTEGRNLRIGNEKGEEAVISRDEVEEMKAQGVSIMPEGLPKVLGPERMRDLLTFLLTPPLTPAPIHLEDAPPPRQLSEVKAVLDAGNGQANTAPADRPLKIVLLAGAKDHGIDEHDYPLWQERWAKLLGMADGVTVVSRQDWPTREDFETADVIFAFFANAAWSAEKGKELEAYLARGGGFIVMHMAVNGAEAPESLADQIGLAWRPGKSKFRHGALDVTFLQGSTNPITAGFDKLHFIDESYWDLIPGKVKADILATCEEEGHTQPLLWTTEHGKGRTFASIPAHYNWTLDDPLYRILLLRGICWTAHQRTDRLNELATIGARVDLSK